MKFKNLKNMQIIPSEELKKFKGGFLDKCGGGCERGCINGCYKACSSGNMNGGTTVEVDV